MILRILNVQPRGEFRLRLSFNNGVRKVVNLEELLRGPIFEPLRDPEYFAQVVLDPVCGTITWPNGADIAPEALLVLDAIEEPCPELLTAH
jgi:hypothetical protein